MSIHEHRNTEYELIQTPEGKWVGKFIDNQGTVRTTAPKETSQHAVNAVLFGINTALRLEELMPAGPITVASGQQLGPEKYKEVMANQTARTDSNLKTFKQKEKEVRDRRMWYRIVKSFILSHLPVPKDVQGITDQDALAEYLGQLEKDFVQQK